MKILQIIQRPQLRGAEIFACQLSEELIKLGHTVDLIYLFPQQQNDLEHFDLTFSTLKAEERKRFWDFKAYKKLAKIVKNGKYDLIQANAGDTLKYAALSKLIHGWKAKLIFRNANKMSAFIKNKLHASLNRCFLSKVDYIISVSENCKQDIIRIYPNAKNRSTTATIGTFDFSKVAPANLDAVGSMWVNVGSFVKEKNHSFLIDVFAAYYDSNKRGHLFLVGDGPLRASLQAQVEKLQLQRSITFLGYRKDVLSIIQASDIMIMPSKIEGLPGVILEALSCGKPVVAAAVGGIPEVIKDNITGYCINGYTKNKYVDKIERILSDRELYSKMSVEGKKLIKTDFLMPQIARRFERIYQAVVDTRE